MMLPLWAIALACQPTGEITRYDQLLDRNREGVLTDAERSELTTVRTQADRFMQRIRPSCCFTTLAWASSPSSCVTFVSAYIPVALKTQIEQCDRHRCCYCLTQAAISGISLSFDHIQPQSQGGPTSFENLCLACRACNEFKSDLTEARDPVTQETVPLFHPRQQNWTDHFTWSSDGTQIEGITAVGRATVLALQLNRAIVVVARRRWVYSGWHPPTD